MMITQKSEQLLNMENGRNMVESFAFSCCVPCRMLSAEGSVLYQQNLEHDLCKKCRNTISAGEPCEKVHLYASYQAERFGGRYIYFCPMGMAWLSAPILLGGKMAGSLSAGPIMIMDMEDYIASTPLFQRNMPLDELETIREVLHIFPRRTPAALNHISMQLLASALYIGDSSLILMQRQQREAQYEDIGTYVQQFKLEGASTAYPLTKEKALMQAITEGDQKDARRLLNELLGHIFFATGGNFTMMRARSVELMTLFSRAAANGGADLEHLLSLNQKFLQESDTLRSTDDLVVWLTRLIVRYTGLVFDTVNVKRKDIIYKAINFMKRNLTQRLTLEETAQHVGFSTTYFSKVFKDEMSVTYNSYLRKLRVERSKVLLLSSKLSLQEICGVVGYEDQSYFIKVFHKYTGVTPGNYRKKQGRLDSSKEREPVQKYKTSRRRKNNEHIERNIRGSAERTFQEN